MSKLINELKQEHKEIAELFQTIVKSGVTSKKGLELVKQSKVMLLQHLEKEDKYLYPPLFEKAQKDFLLKNTLKNFGEELEDVTYIAQRFYSKYLDVKDIKKQEFIEDMSAFNISLKGRIMKEEYSLYRSYEKLNID